MKTESQTLETPTTQTISIELINIDPKQPRQTYNETTIHELAESIKQHGIIQNLVLRAIEKGYIIIAGHRRYLAAKAAGLKEVPATIRSVDDDEALAIQIVENLHREDVHPMQQAQGFKMLIEKKHMNIEDVSTEVGKSPYFVRQQLQLNNLTKEWQDIFLKNGINSPVALQISCLAKEVQNDLYSEQVSKEDLNSTTPYISINQHLIKRYSGDLNTACFNTNDPDLDKKSGACTACPYNTAVASLFPNEQEKPMCNNTVCYKAKIALHINKEMHKVLEDPSTILVYQDWHIPPIVETLKKEGTIVYKLGYGGDCREIHRPEMPTWETYLQQQKSNKKSEKSIRQNFKNDQDTHTFQLEHFNKNLSTGKYKKAFMIHSTNGQSGKYLFIEMNTKSSGKKSPKSITEENATIEDINIEIKRIQEREIRRKELDAEKVHKRLVDTTKEDKTLQILPPKASLSDQILISFLLLEHISYHEKEEIQKVLKSPALWNPTNSNKFKEALQSLTKPQITYLIRRVIIDKYANSLPNSRGGYIFRLMVESLRNVPIVKFETEQKEIAKKRQLSVDHRIAILKEMKSELAKATKSPAKKSTAQKLKP